MPIIGATGQLASGQPCLGVGLGIELLEIPGIAGQRQLP